MRASRSKRCLNSGFSQRWVGRILTNRAIEARVPSAIYLTHPASAQGRLNFIRAEFCTRSESHSCA